MVNSPGWDAGDAGSNPVMGNYRSDWLTWVRIPAEVVLYEHFMHARMGRSWCPFGA